MHTLNLAPAADGHDRPLNKIYCNEDQLDEVCDGSKE
jgi:hypothetical protein